MSNNTDIEPKSYGSVTLILSLIYSIFYIPGIVLTYEYLYMWYIIPQFNLPYYNDQTFAERIIGSNFTLLPVHIIGIILIMYIAKAARASKSGKVWAIICAVILLSDIIIPTVLLYNGTI